MTLKGYGFRKTDKIAVFLISMNLNGCVGVGDIGSYLDGSGDLHAGDGRRDCTMYSMYILYMLMIIFLPILALNAHELQEH